MHDLEEWPSPGLPYRVSYGRHSDQWLLIKSIASHSPHVALLKSEFNFLENNTGHAFPLPLLWQEDGDQCHAVYLVKKMRPLARMMRETRNIGLKVELEWSMSLADALIELHRLGFLLLSCSPYNIAICEQGEGAYFIDWTQTRPRNGTNPFFAGDIPGWDSHRYSQAPEWTAQQIRRPDLAQDVYAFGATLFQLFTQSLFDDKSFVTVISEDLELIGKSETSHLPRMLIKIIQHACERQLNKRYKTVWGVLQDLRDLYSDLDGQIGESESRLGSKDIRDILTFPEQKIYGRDVEFAELDVAYQRLMQGESVCCVISGRTGVGKSLLVEHFLLQHKEDSCLMTETAVQAESLARPYAPLIEAFEYLIQQLLLKPQRELLVWRKKLLDAVGENIALMVEVIPDLSLVIGEPEKVTNLASREEKIRFDITFRNFFRAFCQKEHPLIFHIKGGQWLDRYSLELLVSIFKSERIDHCFLLIAYQEESTLEKISLEQLQSRIATLFVHTLVLPLAPLSGHSTARFLSDVLSCDQDRVEDLAAVLTQKTKGVPALIRGAIEGLWQQGAIAFDYRSFAFFWNLSLAQQWQIDEGVLHSLIHQVEKLKERERAILGAAACLLRDFRVEDIEKLLLEPNGLVRLTLKAAADEGLLVPLGRQSGQEVKTKQWFRFSHEEIRRILYKSLAPQDRRDLHKKIARQAQLITRTDPGSDNLYYTVEQYNLSLDPDESLQDVELAKLNLSLARQTRMSESAPRYLQIAKKCLGETAWASHYGLMLSIHEELAAVAYLQQDFEQLDAVIEETLRHVKNHLDAFVILEIQIALLIPHDLSKALDLARPLLEPLGVKLPARSHPWMTRLIVLSTCRSLQARHRRKRDDRDRDREVSTGHLHNAALRLTTRLAAALESIDPNASTLLLTRALSFGVKHRALATLPYAYASFARSIIGQYGYIRQALILGEEAANLSRIFDDKQQQCRVEQLLSAFVWPWQDSISSCLTGLLRAFRNGVEFGEYEAAAQAIDLYGSYAFYAGMSISRLLEELREYESTIHDLRRDGQSHHADLLRWTLLRLSMEHSEDNLSSPKVRDGDGEGSSRQDAELAFTRDMNRLLLQTYEHRMDPTIGKLMTPASLCASYAYASAIFYQAMYAVRKKESGLLSRAEVLPILRSAERQLRNWSHLAPSNHRHRHLIVSAEIMRWSDRMPETLAHYNAALEIAQKVEAQHEYALALEQLARVFYDLDLKTLARDYLEKALLAYETWGAAQLVSHLRLYYADWGLGPLKVPTLSFQHEGYGLEYLQRSLSDITRETNGHRLIEKILQTAVHLTQAERGHFIIKSYEDDLYHVKQSYEEGTYSFPDANYLNVTDLCRSLVTYVLRTRRSAVINDAQIPQKAVPGLQRDPYVIDKVVRSLVCIPIEIGTSGDRELIGVIYLENNSFSHIFDSDRLQFLELVGQAAAGRLEVSEKAQSLEESLQDAQLVQQALFPSIEELPAFTVADHFKPADHTGGDWYGYYEDEQSSKSYFFIGDVTGHGVSSALITGTAAGAAYSSIATIQQLDRDLSPQEALAVVAHAVNRAVYNTAARVDKMMTMIFACFDAETGQVAFINAAHPNGFVISDYRAKPLMGRGSPLGFHLDPAYQVQTYQLQIGDFLFFYSDGLLENEGPEGERLNARSLIKILESSREPSLIKQAILEQTQLIWQNARAQDDFAFVVIRWDGPQEVTQIKELDEAS